MDKSPDAFRTISEVAEMIGTPAHVLRFWESRFPQIRPVKRAGGRRYYRPADVMLLTGIKSLLHDQGMTIRGVQKILREQGVRHVAALSGGDLPEMRAEDSVADLEQALAASFGIEIEEISIEVEPESATIIALETALRQSSRTAPPPEEPEISAASVEVPELAEALATLPDQSGDQVADEADLFSLLGQFDQPAEDHLNESPETVVLSEDEEILAEISVLAPVAAAHPFDLARRLRRLHSARLHRDGAKIAGIHARLAALHANMSAVEPAPINPLP